MKAGAQHDAPSRGHGCALRAIVRVGSLSPRHWPRGGSGEVGGYDSSPEAPGRGARDRGAQGASSVGQWRGEWGSIRARACSPIGCGGVGTVERTAHRQPGRYGWPGAARRPCHRSWWRRRRRSVQRFGSAGRVRIRSVRSNNFLPNVKPRAACRVNAVWGRGKSVILISMMVADAGKEASYTRSCRRGCRSERRCLRVVRRKGKRNTLLVHVLHDRTWDFGRSE